MSYILFELGGSIQKGLQTHSDPLLINSQEVKARDQQGIVKGERKSQKVEQLRVMCELCQYLEICYGSYIIQIQMSSKESKRKNKGSKKGEEKAENKGQSKQQPKPQVEQEVKPSQQTVETVDTIVKQEVVDPTEAQEPEKKQEQNSVITKGEVYDQTEEVIHHKEEQVIQKESEQVVEESKEKTKEAPQQLEQRESIVEEKEEQTKPKEETIVHNQQVSEEPEIDEVVEGQSGDQPSSEANNRPKSVKEEEKPIVEGKESEKEKDTDSKEKEEKVTLQKSSQLPQPITLIDSTAVGSNEDLDTEAAKETKTSRRLAKFKQKQKKSAPKNQQKSPEIQKFQSQPKKHLISSTVSNIKSKFTRSHHEIQQLKIQKDMDEYKMLQVMIQSKKKENYKTLKEWDDSRISDLSLHLNIVDGLERTLDVVARTSLENIEIYYSTFRQIYNQQEQYANHPMIDTIFTTKNNSLSQNIYINCSCILNALNEENMERSSKAREFGKFIKESILQDIFQHHLQQSRLKLTEIKNRISALKTVLSNTQLESDKKSERLANSFANNLMQLENKKDQDFYELELEFLRISHAIVNIHKHYADMVLEYYQIVKQMELERAEVIKKAIKTYSERIESAYESKTGYESIEQLVKGEESLLIEEFLSLEELIPHNSQEAMKQKIHSQEQGFNVTLLKEYFKNFDIEKFNLRQLILKQYVVTNQTANIENSTLIVTVDQFIHIFSSLDDYTQPTVSYKIDDLLKIRRKANEITLEASAEKRSGMLGLFGWSGKPSSSTIIQFSKKDSAEEAEDYIKKLI